MASEMPHIATGLLFDRAGKLLIYLRDDKPTIPFPNHWDLFGGFVEEGETPERALVREVQEELGWHLEHYEYFRTYNCLEGDVQPNVKHVFCARISASPENLVLQEGQRLKSIALTERGTVRFANILARIVDDFARTVMSERYTKLLNDGE